MKTIEDLRRLREECKAKLDSRKASGVQLIIGLGTCGIAAGGKEVMNAVNDELAKHNLKNVTVIQTGCIGMCEQEVLVDVVRPGEPRVTYGHVTPGDVPKIVEEHIINGRVVADLAVGKIAD
ncbi:MAG: (2Fe-2S) ferredoxin domain-containing protein [Bacillota bacterium]|nr:(2Fe-2S) ferredoxin domain-containing protein [Negativicutes bacterium]